MNSGGSRAALEVLQAELLGDVGRLHSLVASLKSELPAIVAEIRRATAETHNPAMSAGQYLKQISKDEIKAIHAAGLTARHMATHELSGVFAEALRNVHGTVQGRGKQVFDEAIGEFTRRANEANTLLSSKTKEVCAHLEASAIELQTESGKTRWRSMLLVSVVTGVAVGLITAFLTIHALT